MSNQPERLLILAEGFSADPHYGKTARGVLAYGERPVVALLDSTRAGETQNGVPVVASVNDALCFNPTTALVGVATQGGRFPPAWRELLKTAISKDLHVENGRDAVKRSIENLITMNVLKDEQSRNEIIALGTRWQLDLHRQRVVLCILDDAKQPTVVNVDVGQVHGCSVA